MKSFENLNCPYYQELKSLPKYGRFYEVTWKFALPLLSWGWNFNKNKTLEASQYLKLYCHFDNEDGTSKVTAFKRKYNRTQA